MTKWNYRVIRSVGEDETLYSVHEVYYDDEGKPESWTCEPVDLSAESVRALMKDVAWIIRGLTEEVLEVKDGKLVPVSENEYHSEAKGDQR